MRRTEKRNHKKIKLWIIVLIIVTVGLSLIFLLLNSFILNHKNKKSVSTTALSEHYSDDLAGTYFSSDGKEASIISKGNHQWTITYQTADGQVSADFTTNWKIANHCKVSSSTMKKSDGYTGFLITVKQLEKKQKSQNIITVTMSDGNSEHKMIFANQKDFFLSDYDAILQGDLSSFEGAYSNDGLEQSIADSGFRLYAYNPEDYYQNRTSVFPRISKNIKTGNEWMYWSGALHAHYKLNRNQLPKKIGAYYEVYFLGSNAIAIEGQEFVLTLVPPNVKGPDGTIAEEKRLFFGQDYQIKFREYHDNWWQTYQLQHSENDLDIAAINEGDFSSLAGTWKNGDGQVLVINADGRVNNDARIENINNSDTNSSIPYVSMHYHSTSTSTAIGLFKIGFVNPSGDQSDTSRPRLVIAQQAGNYSANQYYYRQ